MLPTVPCRLARSPQSSFHPSDGQRLFPREACTRGRRGWMFGAAPAGDRVSRVNRARAEAEAIAMIAQAPPPIQRRSFAKPIERQPCLAQKRQCGRAVRRTGGRHWRRRTNRESPAVVRRVSVQASAESIERISTALSKTGGNDAAALRVRRRRSHRSGRRRQPACVQPQCCRSSYGAGCILPGLCFACCKLHAACCRRTDVVLPCARDVAAESSHRIGSGCATHVRACVRACCGWQVAEQYIEVFGKLAKECNTIVLPERLDPPPSLQRRMLAVSRTCHEPFTGADPRMRRCSFGTCALRRATASRMASSLERHSARKHGRRLGDDGAGIVGLSAFRLRPSAVCAR